MQNFYLIIIASIIVHLFIFYKAIGITYFTRSLKETNGKLALTDNEKILFNAKKYKIFAWPSSMHDMPFNRAQLREFWFLAVSIISKIFMKSNDIIIVSLSLLSNFISIIFIFLIFNHLFNQETAFIVTLFYLTSLWPYQISFYVGHILFSQVWFLFSIFILTLHQIYDLQFISFFLAGAFLVLCFASSSSSRKFPPLIIALFFFINIENIFVFNFEYFLDRIENIFIFFLISFTIIYLLNQIVNKKLNFYINSKNYSKKKKRK